MMMRAAYRLWWWVGGDGKGRGSQVDEQGSEYTEITRWWGSCGLRDSNKEDHKQASEQYSKRSWLLPQKARYCATCHTLDDYFVKMTTTTTITTIRPIVVIVVQLVTVVHDYEIE